MGLGNIRVRAGQILKNTRSRISDFLGEIWEKAKKIPFLSQITEEKARKVLSVLKYFLPDALLLVLFFAPITVSSLDLYADSAEFLAPSRILAFRLPFSGELSLQFGFTRVLLHLIYAFPCAVIFSVTAFFLEKYRGISFKKLNYILTFCCFSVYLFCGAVCIVSNANCFEWFLHVPFCVYLTFFVTLFLHVFYAFYGIFYLRSSNPEYVEYRAIRDSQKHRLSIKTKFTFVITGVIVVILLAFMLLILNSYKKMFTEAVSDVGRAQAEQTAAVYDSAEGRYGKIAPFFEEQRIANEYAETPFERIDVIITSKREPPVFLERWETATLPDFDVFAYTTFTDEKGKLKELDEGEKSVSSQKAAEYLKLYKSGAYKKGYVFDKIRHTCKYIYPVTVEVANGEEKARKLLGFSIVTYRQQVLMRQYFRTKIFVFTIISIFLYVTVIGSILLADFIFNPLLFLRKNVRKTSRSIEEILGGSAKNASSALKFSDTIKTADEIKDLSVEIGDMVSLIKGIMPYVSFSTLQHAEKIGEDSGKNGTVSRDLCFLFTDIRGFTSLCEGMPPKKVVELLNHYLDIETQIILENGGDIDKFVGDEMMAVFSGARKEINACKAAMEIRAAMRKEQQHSMEEGLTYVSIGIGINTGEVIFGPVGSRTRKDFTSIGDTVNLAARLESANKAYGSKSIITEAVFKKLRGLFICRELDFITVKGKTEPVRIYEILQQKSQATKNKASDKLTEIKTLFEKGLELYRAQNWEESEKCFSECALKYNDLPSVVFLDRISHFKSNPPPEDWDGVFKMSVK